MDNNDEKEIQTIIVMHKIYDIQLSILQDYLEIKMREIHSDNWIKKIIEVCEKKVNKCEDDKKLGKSYPSYYGKYKAIVDIKNDIGEILINKKSFDISFLTSLLSYDLKFLCYAVRFDNEEAKRNNKELFMKYIEKIQNDRNELHGHLSDTSNEYRIGSLTSKSIEDLNNFLSYLDLIGWCKGALPQQNFIKTYKAKIESLNDWNYGRININQILSQTPHKKEIINNSSSINDDKSSNKQKSIVQRVNIFVAVKDQMDRFIPGYNLKLLNSKNETIAMWTSSTSSFSLLTDVGEYHIEEVVVPKDYKKGDIFKFIVKSEDANKTFVKTVEHSISNEELYTKAFKYLTDSKTYEQGISLLFKLEKDNFLEAQLLLAFLLRTGICCKADISKAEELLMFAGLQKDEGTWLDCAVNNINEGKYALAFPYYTAYSQKTEKGNGYYQAGRLLITNVKNYEFCRTCFKLAIENGLNDENAKKAYDFICKIGKEQYMKL